MVKRWPPLNPSNKHKYQNFSTIIIVTKKVLPHLKYVAFALAAITALAGLAAASAYGFFAYQKLGYEKRALEESVSMLQKTRDDLTLNLENERNQNQSLSASLRSEQDKNQMFSSQIQQISGTVGKLDKLSKTPPELLKKYSKVYFLNENYAPMPLEAIDSQYLFEPARTQLIFGSVRNFLLNMLAAAKADGKPLEVVSAYRSFYEQENVKTGYKVLYGSGANRFSADQGYSEHQLGTAVDLTVPEIDGLSVKFNATPSYQWLTQNAHHYGFILSYPKENNYYQYEPWHWRFVGVALATRLHDQGILFYNLPQADIDPYLISIFD